MSELRVAGQPRMLAATNQIEPVPRRVRAVAAGRVVLDSTSVLYVWEWPNYPQFHVPLTDVDSDLLVDEQEQESTERGTVRHVGLRAGDDVRPHAARVYGANALPGLVDHVRFRWDALDAWFEEEEEVFVHPRNPYTRVDAVRSSRHVVVSLDGVRLAESTAPVAVFETGLPTRFYLDRSCVDFTRLEPSETVTRCPYKGRTSRTWSARTDTGLHEDIAWSYDFPTRELLPIAGLVAFYDEAVDVTLDGVDQDRPHTHLR